MKTWVRKSLKVGVLSAGLLLFAGSAAHADFTQVSAGNDGVLNGTQIAVPIQVPINACGIGVGAVIGVGVGASGACVNGAALDVDHGNGNGKSAKVGTAGKAGKAGKAHGKGNDYKAKSTESARNEDTSQISVDNDGVLNGTQAYVPVQVPVNACGIGVGAVIGVGAGISGICANGAANDVDTHGKGRSQRTVKSAPAATESARTEDTTQWSQGNDGVLNGTQVYVPIQIPINACGIGVGVLGVGAGLSGGCFNGAIHDAESARTEDTTQISKDNNGVGNGTQVYVPIQIPINACGIGVGVLGVGAGLSGGCFNGALNDVGGGDNGNGGGKDYHKAGKKSAGTTEALPTLPGTAALPAVPVLGGATNSLPLAGNLGSGLKTSKMNVAGVDPMQLLDPMSGQTSALQNLPAGVPAMA
jgi:hypothetical protein